VEDFKLVDRRLAICTTACSFSLLALVYDYLYPFPASRYVLATCAIRYPASMTTQSEQCQVLSFEFVTLKGYPQW